MTTSVKPTAEVVRQARIDNPKVRERDLAIQLGISEAELVAAHVGFGAIRLEPNTDTLLNGIGAVGEVLALTRNFSAVHEKIGPYENVRPGKHAALVLGEQIDLRIFPKVWASGFAVDKADGDTVRRSLQFFDRNGDAVHKIHLRPASNRDAYHLLVEQLKSEDQSQLIPTREKTASEADPYDTNVDVTALRDRWSKMTDTHQFVGILRDLRLSRQQALKSVGLDYAWPLDNDTVSAMLHHSVQEEIPIMCFVGSKGCIQIHTGPIRNIKAMGPWINILDETFHLHLRNDHIKQVWAVRKPSKDGHITSLEAYDAQGEMIIQFFGKRHEGHAESADWRTLVESLPRLASSFAA
ncbi:MAG: hemin-degrading factor [Phyllobacterium sp.]